jgi:hypothetical protein
MRRHVVIDHGWDEAKGKGWMQFRCNTCGYEYRMWMINKHWKVTPPAKPGQKPKRIRAPYTPFQLKFFASYWGPKTGSKTDGVSVSSCKGCLPKRPVRR